ncbi:hypothetical protein F966_00833 [Acinetobacter higginsii]|uniref:Uncharacterized protein n=1 Tax=Acinetobacter higginsii TaxID=70347 RepID=N8XUD3_9GAMM|nr:hypothetical protein [Acinetobacter higginsii]ENV11048.1 hypothetical protein F966_00833 [Acinetobacter higginsii]
MTKKFNSRLVEWGNELGQDLLKDMKALEKRNFKASDALRYIHLQKDFGQSDYKSAKQEFNQVIDKLQKLPTKNVHFVRVKWLAWKVKLVLL